jgi:uncharacterized protein YjiS (DUF1127 family)
MAKPCVPLIATGRMAPTVAANLHDPASIWAARPVDSWPASRALKKHPPEWQIQVFSLTISFLSYAFLHRCSATLLLFPSRNIPILRASQFTGAAGPRLRGTTMFASIVRFIRRWNRYNQSLTELSRLGDRELADIGISRSDIPRVAWGAAHQR